MNVLTWRRMWFLWCALVIGLAACGGAYKFHGTQLEPPKPAAAFTLTNQDGVTVRLDDYRGQLVMLFFGYTHCPDICPLTLSEFKQIREQLGADAQYVRFVLISVDPERDTPEQLKTYLAQFDTSFQGLTGSPQELVSLYREYGIFVESARLDSTSTGQLRAAPGFTIAHTNAVLLLDGKGRLRVIYTDASWQDMAADVRQMIAAREYD